MWTSAIRAWFVSNADDCNDLYTNVYPGAEEICDELDNDCDGQIDVNATDPLTWYLDEDEDGYGVDTVTVAQCEQPEGFAPAAGDCDPLDATVSPGAAEISDGLDNTCSGAVPTDEVDDDGDGHVECSFNTPWLGAPGVVAGSDCDDTDPTVHPNAAEICDGLSNVCLGAVPTDETDDDGDGYVECTVDPSTWAGPASVAGGEDCDDSDPN